MNRFKCLAWSSGLCRRKCRSLPKPKQMGGWWRSCAVGSVGITTQPDARMGVDGARTWIGAFLMNIIVHAEKGGRRNDTYEFKN